MELSRKIAIARGDEPAERLLKNAQLVNVFTGEIYTTHIAIAGPFVIGLGEGYQAPEVVDLENRYVCPGFIDAHVHIESALVPPHEFARAVVPHGVTTVITDPHEIANVLGLEGIRFMIEDAHQVPLSVYFNAPSCVPATSMATSGAKLKAEELASLLQEPAVLGLAEVMNFPGVIRGEPSLLAKIQAFEGRVLDGHCPRLTGLPLNAYVIAGMSSDHECTLKEEAQEKLRLGMRVFIREATSARNLKTLIQTVSPDNERRFCFCTDDRHPADLLEEGSIDHLIRLAIAEGLHPVTAIRMATLNPAEHFRLHDRGAIAPGRRADLVVFSDLQSPRAELVYYGGQLVAQEGNPLWMASGVPPKIRNTVHLDRSTLDFTIRAQGNWIRVIGIVPNQLVTEALVMEARIQAGKAVADVERDLLKVAVIERHRASGNRGLGFVKGLGLQRGAIASTVAHDHHNLIVAGVDDRSMSTAACALAEVGGGQAVAEGDKLLALLPLPIAGLMSDQPIEQVRTQMDTLLNAARSLGSTLHNPFMQLSFLGLEVIPALKITDAGLVDVDRFEVVPLFVGR